MTDQEIENQDQWLRIHYPETVRWIRFCSMAQLVVVAMTLSGLCIRSTWFWILVAVVAAAYVVIEVGIRFVADLQLDEYRIETIDECIKDLTTDIQSKWEQALEDWDGVEDFETYINRYHDR